MVISSPRAGSTASPLAPLEWGDDKEHKRKIAEVANRALIGKTNNVTTVTLTASSATTTITDRRIGYNTVVILVPTTANASAEFGNGTIYQTYPNATKNQAVINHANNAQSDRTYAVAFVG